MVDLLAVLEECGLDTPEKIEEYRRSQEERDRLWGEMNESFNHYSKHEKLEQKMKKYELKMTFLLVDIWKKVVNIQISEQDIDMFSKKIGSLKRYAKMYEDHSKKCGYCNEHSKNTFHEGIKEDIERFNGNLTSFINCYNATRGVR